MVPAAEEHELIGRARGGDLSAFEALVRRYQDRVYNLAYQLLRHREDALEVSQEAFAKAYRSLAHFKGGSSFFTWLYRIVTNLALDQLRRQGREGILHHGERGPEEREWQEGASDPLETLKAKELERALEQAIAALPPSQRAIFLLREVDGQDPDERQKKLVGFGQLRKVRGTRGSSG